MLSIARTPLRISFFGGGSDYPSYFENHPGAVLGTTINKYVYTIALPMASFAERPYRVTYRTVDFVDSIDEINHPVVRVGLKDLGYTDPINIAIISDLPGGTGLGSSSAFTVGFVNLISSLKGRQLSRYDLAQKAIHIEQNLLKENVGVQDQVHAAFGGLSCYTFHKKEFTIRPVNIHTEGRALLNESLILVHTGMSRHASANLTEQMENTKSKKIDKELSHLVKLTEQGIAVLEQPSPEAMLKDLGEMLKEAWQTKRSLSTSISNSHVDEIYEKGLALGAIGGKLCGAGNGGFFLFIVPSEKIPSFADAFGRERVVKIEMEDSGSVVMRQ